MVFFKESVRSAADDFYAIALHIVERHRSTGHTLTWALLHDIADESLVRLRALGEHDPVTIRLLEPPPTLPYPRDETPVDFDGSDAVPIAFSLIHHAYRWCH